MAEEIRHPNGRIEHPSVRSEATDASFPWIGGTVAAAAVLGILILLGVGIYFNHAKSALDRTRASRFPLAEKPSWTLPPEPRLEQLNRLAGSGASDAFARQAVKLEHLRGVGPTDEKGFVHIPIERALKLLANKLPARSQTSPWAVTMTETLGLLGGPTEQGPLCAAAAIFPGRTQIEATSWRRRDKGLLDAGGPNSGRLFNRSTPQ
jgi:hypothetical protein